MKPDSKHLDLEPSSLSPFKLRTTTVNAGGALNTSSGSSTSSSGYLSARTTAKPINHSGNLPGLPSTLRSVAAATTLNSEPGHCRSVSTGAPQIYFGGSFGAAKANVATSSPNLFPSRNICPTRKTLKTGLPSCGSTRPNVLGSGTVNYGRGSIMRGGGTTKLGNGGGHDGDDNLGGNPVVVGALGLMLKRAMVGSDPEEVKNVGNELYKNGNFAKALALYDSVVAMSPRNVAYQSNRAATLTALGRLGEVVRECDEAVKLDPACARADKRLASKDSFKGFKFKIYRC